MAGLGDLLPGWSVGDIIEYAGYATLLGFLAYRLMEAAA
jgi:hypothetical protein